MKTVKWQHLKTSPSTAVRLKGFNLHPFMLCTEQKHKKENPWQNGQSQWMYFTTRLVCAQKPRRGHTSPDQCHS